MYKVTVYCSNGDRVIHLAKSIKDAVVWSSEYNKNGDLVGFNVYKVKENEEK